MNKRKTGRRTTTLSISLTEELSEAISGRVRSGMYTSASELIREALRLLLKVEVMQHARLARPQPGAVAESGPNAAMRFANSIDLFDLGASLREARLVGGDPNPSMEELQNRLNAEEEQLEAGPGLRIAPDRLARLKVDE